MPTATICNDPLVETVRKYGGQASDALLDLDCKQFSVAGIEGFIGYKTACNCAILFGDPVALPDHHQILLDAFFDTFASKFHNILILTASESLKQMTLGKTFKASVQFGNELAIDPFDDPLKRTGEKASLVRRKVRHAAKEGVIVREYTIPDEKLEHDIEELAVKWRESRKGVQIHTSQIKIFSNRLGKRWFYAERNGKVLGVLLLNKTESTNGYLLNRYLVLPEAPGGVPESLVVCALDTLRAEGCHHLSFGASVDLSRENVQGLNSMQDWIARKILAFSNKLFKLSQRQTFWEKFHPNASASYILFQKPQIGLKELIALCKTLNVSL